MTMNKPLVMIPTPKQGMIQGIKGRDVHALVALSVLSKSEKVSLKRYAPNRKRADW